MDICFVTAEVAPIAKVGGLADVAAALPPALARSGHRITVILPYYRDLKVDRTKFQARSELDGTIQMADRTLNFQGFSGPFPASDATGAANLQLILVACDELFDRPGIYADEPDEFLRFLFLSRAALEICQRLRFAPDILHCNDWQTAPIPLLLKANYSWDQLFSKTSTVLTIHNIGHQGVFSADILPYFDLGENEYLLHQDDLRDGMINFMKTGLIYADAITAVSPTYANQIQTAEYGMGLEGLLQSRKSSLYGILNGMDSQEWSPSTDPLIPYAFSAGDLAGKTKNKLHLLQEMGVAPDPDAPTIGIVSRLAIQKGFDLLFPCLETILATNDMRLVVLGSGQQEYVDYFTQLRRTFPTKVGFFHGFDNSLAHLIEAGSDMFLMPSKYEPCGLNQMYSQAYGTIPIVRDTGGLADTVEHFNPSTGNGTGVVFEHYTAEGVEWAIRFALELYHDRGHWAKIMQNAMARDFSWETQAQHYVRLYQQIGAAKAN